MQWIGLQSFYIFILRIQLVCSHGKIITQRKQVRLGPDLYSLLFQNVPFLTLSAPDDISWSGWSFFYSHKPILHFLHIVRVLCCTLHTRAETSRGGRSKRGICLGVHVEGGTKRRCDSPFNTKNIMKNT